MVEGTHCGVQARVQEARNRFLIFSQKLKVIFGGFASVNPLDSRVTEGEPKGPDYRGLIRSVIRFFLLIANFTRTSNIPP